MMDTLTRMKAFKEVVDAEGFSAAARRIGKSKALLSKYVRELEDEVGVLLLNRTTRKFSMTESGHTYYQSAVDILRQIDELQDSVRENSKDPSGRIKLSAPRTFADSAIGQCLIDFMREHPEIELEAHLDDRFVDIVDDGFDLAIRVTQLEDSSMIAKRLAPFTLIVAASPALIEQTGQPKTPEDLLDMPCVTDTNGRWRHNWPFVREDGTKYTVHVKGPLDANSPEMVKRAVLAGLGFAIIPELLVREELEDGSLIKVFEKEIQNESGIYAIYPHRRYLPIRVRALVDFLAKWMRENGYTTG